MTRVLVVYATKMGGTAGIAGAIADELRSCGVVADLRDADDAPAVADYDAVVLGSAVYAGRWRRSAVELLRMLVRIRYPGRVWLFHSGPTGADAPGSATAVPRRVADLAARLGAPPARTFGGRLESGSAKGFIARQMAKGDLAGDFRDFERIRAWARHISLALKVTA